jgi:uncharacterized protein YjdB
MFDHSLLKALMLIGIALPLAGCNSTGGLDSISISPNTQLQLVVGNSATIQLTATGTYGNGSHPTTSNITNQVTWTSAIPAVATVSSTGLVSAGVTAGYTTITATAQGFNGVVSASVEVTVNAGTGSSEPVTALTIAPSTDTVATVGQTGQFIAIGTTSAGLSENLTSKVAWSVTNSSVATIGAATGLATAVGSGTTGVTAIWTNPDGTAETASASFTVTGSSTEPLQSITITPSSLTAVVGQNMQLIAIGTYSSTSSTPGTRNLTSTATWTSSNTSVASITTSGSLTAAGAGTTVITAIAPNPDGSLVTGTATLTVTATSGSGGSSTAEPLSSLAIIPASQTLTAVGQIVNLIAIGTTSSSTTVNLTNQSATIGSSTIKAAAWSSSVPSVASIDPATGIATAVGNGTTAITAIAYNPDGTVVIGAGTLTVTASASSQQITSMAIIPGSQTVTMPLTTPTSPTTSFVAIGTIGSTGLQVNETNSASWSSSNTAVATIGAATGLATPVGQGTTTITAQYNNASTSTTPASVVTATATLTVNGVEAEPLLSLAILPSAQSISYPGQTSQLTAIGTFSEAPVTQNLTNSTTYPVTWTSSNTSVATVCTSGSPAPCTALTYGLVTAVGKGTAAITAIASNPDNSVVTGVATITVENGVAEQITALTIIPGSLSLSATGQPGQFVALGTNGTTGLLEDVTDSPQLTWSSSIPSYATISTYPAANPGLASGVSAGTTNITAEWTNTDKTAVTATASVSVTTTAAAEPLLSIAVVPSSVTDLNLEGTAQFLAYGTFSTAPTVLEITNGFYHSGFPNSSCTAAYAAADAAAAAADAAANLPVTNLPYAQCSFVPTTWVSTLPFDFPINSAGAAGAYGGLATADASGTADIYAVAANPDGTLAYSSDKASGGMATFNCPYAAPTYGTTTTTLANGTTVTTTDYSDLLNPGTCNSLTVADSLLSTLTVFNASQTSTGLNQSNWLITADSATGTKDVIHCGGTTEQATPEGSVCEATYPNGTVVTLTAPAETGVNFGGWSSNCTAQGNVTAAGPNSCTVVVGGGCVLNVNTGTYTCSNSSSVTVGAVFN